MHADRILVIEDGAIVEAGRHEDLLRKGGRYASFYWLQLQDEAPRPPRSRSHRNAVAVSVFAGGPRRPVTHRLAGC